MRTPQQPIGSGFTAASTTNDVIRGIDLTGRTVIVTGGYSGLGLETARTLRSAGASVIVPARDVARATTALAGVEGVEIDAMDLLDPASIDAFAGRFLARGVPLDILINNAAIMANPLTRDARGFESQFSTNHLGHFQLTARLWQALVKAEGARVVAVSSLGHRFSPVVFEDPNFDHREYDPWAGYGQSKTANILFAVELDRRGQDRGVRAFSLHPGGIASTGLGKHVPMEAFTSLGFIKEDGTPVIDPDRGLKTVEQGAATQVWCATSPTLDGLGGLYCENVEIALPASESPATHVGIDDVVTATGVRDYAIDPDLAVRLWQMSETLLDLEACR